MGSKKSPQQTYSIDAVSALLHVNPQPPPIAGFSAEYISAKYVFAKNLMKNIWCTVIATKLS